jgi:hypothetical protein
MQHQGVLWANNKSRALAITGRRIPGQLPKILPIGIGECVSAPRVGRFNRLVNTFRVFIGHKRDRLGLLAKGIDSRFEGGFLRREKTAGDDAGEVLLSLWRKFSNHNAEPITLRLLRQGMGG